MLLKTLVGCIIGAASVRMYFCLPWRCTMSLNAPLFYLIPEETVQVAQAAFPKSNRYLRVRDTFGSLVENPTFAHLFSHTGQPAEDPARLALITILQFAERLSDEQAADKEARGNTHREPLCYGGSGCAAVAHSRYPLS